jgi:hypothetical protein
MRFDIDRVRANLKRASTPELLDRYVFFRGGLEEEAVTALRDELRSRGVAEEAMQAHRDASPDVLWETPALAYRCWKCEQPAVVCERRWHKMWGILPLYPRPVYCCPAHRSAPKV